MYIVSANSLDSSSELDQTDNLGQVERIISDSVEDEVLKLVDGTKEIISESRHFSEMPLVGKL